MAGNKSSEVINRIKQDLKWNRITNQDLKDIIFSNDWSTGEDYSVITIDVSDSIKGLKAIQREAKKSTAALKELEEQKKKNMALPTGGYNPHKVVFDEMDTHPNHPVSKGTVTVGGGKK